MNSCKNFCLISNCQEKVTNYVNFTRYHSICDSHLSSIEQLETSILCTNCNNEIQCIKDLPLRNKAEYKKSLLKSLKVDENKSKSSDLTQSPLTPVLITHKPTSSASLVATQSKCTWLKCNIKRNVRKTCEDHMLCENHFKAENFCTQCKCPTCSKFGVHLKKCGAKMCDNCAVKFECCFECCVKTVKNSLLKQKCNHFLCLACQRKRGYCLCKSCQICNNFESIDKNCSHLICKNCEIKGKCPICTTGTCESCGDLKPLDIYKCQIHSFCLDCEKNHPKCPLCPSICIRCNKNDSSEASQCKSHPLCEDCSKEFQKGFCVYCEDLQRFTCEACKKTFDTFSDNGCNHQICKNCSDLECGHRDCPTCLKEVGFCVKCQPSSFCTSCKKRRKNERISCFHGLCLECGILNKDEHYCCVTCGSHEYFKNGECLKCNGSICGNCQKIEEIPTYECGHKICSDCFEKQSICPLCLFEVECSYCEKTKISFYQSCRKHSCCLDCSISINTKNCLFCEGISENYRCSFCLFYYEKVEKLGCLHLACNGCLLINKNHCELCIECSICHKQSPKASLNCDHQVCQNCQNQSNNQDCLICNKTLTYCNICASFMKSTTCDQNHELCIGCSKKFQRKYQDTCFKCISYCFYCKGTKEITMLDCRHTVCHDCNEMNIKSKCNCLLCKNSNTCNFCHKVYLDEGFIPLTCDHKICLSCPDKGPIKKCKKCKPRYFCIKCGKCDLKSRISCKHYLCEECGIKAKDKHYFCNKCDNTDNFYRGKCQNCAKRFTGYCKKCQYPHKVECKHSLCTECMYNFDICKYCYQELSCSMCNSKENSDKIICKIHKFCNTCQSQINREDCIICLNLQNEYRCMFCPKKTEKCKILPCGCKACKSCIAANRALCIRSTPCDKCGIFSHSKTFQKCIHKFCNSCKDSFARDSCFVCNCEKFEKKIKENLENLRKAQSFMKSIESDFRKKRKEMHREISEYEEKLNEKSQFDHLDPMHQKIIKKRLILPDYQNLEKFQKIESFRYEEEKNESEYRN